MRPLKLFLPLFLLPLLSFCQTITNIAGTGNSAFSADNIPATASNIGMVASVTIGGDGNLYIADDGNARVRKVELNTGFISTVAGNGLYGYSPDGGLATNSKLADMAGVAINAAGDIYIALYSTIAKVDHSTGILTTAVGTGILTFTGDAGPANAASVNRPYGICFDGNGDLLIADCHNYRIRKVDAAGIITTIAGTGVNAFSGDGGPAISAGIGEIYSICTDQANNIYIASMNLARVRKIDAVTGVITTIAGNGTVGSSGDGGLATAAEISNAHGVICDKMGNIYIGDNGNHKIRKVDNAGIITTVAGTGIEGYSGDGGLASAAQMNMPFDVTVDSCGNLFVGDFLNYRVRRIEFNSGCAPLHASLVPVTLSLSVAPNPVTSQFTIISNTVIKEVSIINSLGQTVRNKICNAQKVSLYIAELPAGLYFVSVTDMNGSKKLEKLIKE